MFKIAFTVFVMTVNGPMPGTVKEKTTFSTMEQCEQFGENTHGRVADWVRGYHHMDWDDPVKVLWKCEAEGDPA